MARGEARSCRKPGDIACYIELHIEQGGLLEKAGLQIGVVQGIVGLRWFEVTITGFANHAGATPDGPAPRCMLAAAKFTVAVNEAITGEPGRQVATVGRLNVLPNTTNVIPGQVVLTVDLRDLDAGKIRRFQQRFEQLGREIGAATGTTFAFKSLTDSEPALADPQVMDWIEGSAASLGLTRQRMPSGAGHDAQEIAHIAPMGMIFVPSVGGISHSPKEFTQGRGRHAWRRRAAQRRDRRGQRLTATQPRGDLVGQAGQFAPQCARRVIPPGARDGHIRHESNESRQRAEGRRCRPAGDESREDGGADGAEVQDELAPVGPAIDADHGAGIVGQDGDGAAAVARVVAPLHGTAHVAGLSRLAESLANDGRDSRISFADAWRSTRRTSWTSDDAPQSSDGAVAVLTGKAAAARATCSGAMSTCSAIRWISASE